MFIYPPAPRRGPSGCEGYLIIFRFEVDFQSAVKLLIVILQSAVKLSILILQSVNCQRQTVNCELLMVSPPSPP